MVNAFIHDQSSQQSMRLATLAGRLAALARARFARPEARCARKGARYARQSSLRSLGGSLRSPRGSLRSPSQSFPVTFSHYRSNFQYLPVFFRRAWGVPCACSTAGGGAAPCLSAPDGTFACKVVPWKLTKNSNILKASGVPQEGLGVLRDGWRCPRTTTDKGRPHAPPPHPARGPPGARARRCGFDMSIST